VISRSSLLKPQPYPGFIIFLFFVFFFWFANHFSFDQVTQHGKLKIYICNCNRNCIARYGRHINTHSYKNRKPNAIWKAQHQRQVSTQLLCNWRPNGRSMQFIPLQFAHFSKNYFPFLIELLSTWAELLIVRWVAKLIWWLCGAVALSPWFERIFSHGNCKFIGSRKRLNRKTKNYWIIHSVLSRTKDEQSKIISSWITW